MTLLLFLHTLRINFFDLSKIYDDNAQRKLFELVLNQNFEYIVRSSTFHTIRIQERLIGIGFDEEEDAKIFSRAIKENTTHQERASVMGPNLISYAQLEKVREPPIKPVKQSVSYLKNSKATPNKSNIGAPNPDTMVHHAGLRSASVSAVDLDIVVKELVSVANLNVDILNDPQQRKEIEQFCIEKDAVESVKGYITNKWYNRAVNGGISARRDRPTTIWYDELDKDAIEGYIEQDYEINKYDKKISKAPDAKSVVSASPSFETIPEDNDDMNCDDEHSPSLDTDQVENAVTLSNGTYGSSDLPMPPPPPQLILTRDNLDRRPTLTIQDELNLKKRMENQGLKRTNTIANGSDLGHNGRNTVLDALQGALTKIKAANEDHGNFSDEDDEWSD